ncbi:hypothetical protein AMJ80_10000 [bacterium SM23_31]|nr:MAG: hypothetical protein AMJ80_10000 [bacterium SM23_31]
MKIQLPFLKVISIICLSIFILLLNCSPDVEFQTMEVEPPLTDVLTLELAFGDENTIDDYDFLLAKPGYYITVNSRNEILVIDELKIKVYDGSGKGIKIFGGRGQGPGEFIRPMFIWTGPTDYITVFGGTTLYNGTLHYFKPDFSFINRKMYDKDFNIYKMAISAQNSDLRPCMPEQVIQLNETERIIIFDAEQIQRAGMREQKYHREVFLFYEKADTLLTLAHYVQSNFIPETGTFRISDLGWLEADYLPDNRFVFIHSFHDSRIGSSDADYTLTILSLDTMKKTFITHWFKPVELDWVPYEYPEEEKKKYPGEYKRSLEQAKKRKDFNAERKYKAALQELLTDGNYIFAFTHFVNENNETLADIFDAVEGKYLHSAYFSVIPTVIKNGYGYRVGRNSEGFSVIEKYKINPAVYRK